MWNKLFPVGSATLLVLTSLWIWKDTNPEWVRYQKGFKKLAQGMPISPKEKEEIQRKGYGIRQMVLDKLKRVDRCPTCHLGIDYKAFIQAKNPYKFHPPEILLKHPIEKYGCTLCHGGQGWATTKKAAFGKVRHWYQPILEGDYVQASCGKCHFEDYIRGAPLLSVGKRLYDFYGCRNCHKIYKEGGTAGVELTKVASKQENWFVWGDYRGKRNLANWFFLHFKNSQRFQPDSKMINYRMSEEAAVALTIYMLSLTGEEFPEEYRIDKRPEG